MSSMDLTKCMKDELLPLAAELRLEVNGKMRKPEIRRATQRWISRRTISQMCGLKFVKLKGKGRGAKEAGWQTEEAGQKRCKRCPD